MQFTSIVATFALFASPLAAQEIDIQEAFALSKDRAQVLELLVPGTQDYYFYHCLQAQHLGEFAKVPPLLEAWVARHGRSERVQRIEHRQALLAFEQNPAGTYAHLQRELGLKFDHLPDRPEESAPLPTGLDNALLDPSRLTSRALARSPRGLGDFEDSMLAGLAQGPLSDEQLRELLERLRRPDVPNLPALIVRDLKSKGSGGFGSLPIHRALLLEQLEALLALTPDILRDQDYVESYLARLLPGADENWSEDRAVREAYLDRLWSFAQRLPASHNGLKSHVLQHRLQHDLEIGRPDRDRFLDFLRLPRRSDYANREHLDRFRSREVVRSSQGEWTPLGDPGDDMRLVRRYLEHFFVADANWEGFAEYVREEYLRRVFAETKLLAGVGNLERWYTMLDNSEAYEALERRVDLEFPLTQKQHFAPDEPVRLELDTKNVRTLLVKVFEIDALAYALDREQDVDASIDLDGLVAASEQTYNYNENPLRRVRRQFEFPALSRPGTYVIDFISGGLSSRAVISKGHLQLRERLGSAGHVFQLADEAGRPLEEAAIWFEGRRFVAEQGEIHLPYAAKASGATLILQSGSMVRVQNFYHRQEQYRLSTGAYIDREALRAEGKAQLLLRTRLFVHGADCSLELLENPVLTLSATLIDGTPTSLDLRDLQLAAGQEFVHEFQVPAGLQNLSVQLRADVQNLSLGDRQTLVSKRHFFELNKIDSTAEVENPLLVRSDQGYALDLLGKNGEAIADRNLQLAFEVRGFRQSVDVQLRTDAKGRVQLGELAGVKAIRLAGLVGGNARWLLHERRASSSSRWHALEGELVRVPHQGGDGSLNDLGVSLLELRDGQFVANRISHVALRDGFLEIQDLPAGAYDLWLASEGRQLRINITAGSQQGNWAVGKSWSLETRPLAPQLVAAKLDQAGIELRIDGHEPRTRVHLVGTRFENQYDAFERLRLPGAPALREVAFDRRPSSYHSGREIGEEYRYILERRFAQKYPGNLLPRPGLLLNPWSMQDSETMIGVGGGAGGRFGGRAGGAAPASAAESEDSIGQEAVSPASFVNLDYLAQASTSLFNLRPDAQGVLRVPAEELGEHQEWRVLVVHGRDTIEARLHGPSRAIALRDRRLKDPLAPGASASRQRLIELVQAEQEYALFDEDTVEAKTYESLEDVFQLFRTLRPGTELSTFAFLLDWSGMELERKRELYSKHACHELHLFLHQRDREFFDSEISPFLSNKTDKTFIDHWLLGDDLRPFLQPRAFQRLNVVERILLGRRLEGERANITRLLRDLAELRTTNAEQEEKSLDALFASDALDEAPRRKSKTYAGPSTPGPAAPGKSGARTDKDSRKEVAPAELADFEAVSLERDLEFRARTQTLYKSLRSTEQFVEHNWWHQPIGNHHAGLIRVNDFWVDFAGAGSNEAFLSKHLTQAAGNLNEMLCALAFLDLPLRVTSPKIVDLQATRRASSPLILIRERIAPATPLEDGSPLLLGQEFFDLARRYRHEGGRQEEVLMREGFRSGVAYGCRVVLTNPSAKAIESQLLLQIPAGSIPLLRTRSLASLPTELGAYETFATEYAFYFPHQGRFEHFPAHANADAEVLARAAPLEFAVLDEEPSLDRTSWEYLSQRAELPELLEHLASANLQRLELGRLAWRMGERANFDALLGVLRQRHSYNSLLWSYGIKHRDERTAREFLDHHGSLASACGPWLASPLLKVDPVERLSWERVEFLPLVNARAHRLGGKREIRNRDLERHYRSILNILVHKSERDATDWMSLTYHLLLQERIGEALEMFGRVDSSELPMQIQYDYMRAYLDFFSDSPQVAGDIAAAYANYPVPHWRKRFAAIGEQLDEARGLTAGRAGGISDSTAQAGGRSEEAVLELELENGELVLQHGQLQSCELRYYVMDVEFLFSKSPFVRQGANAFDYVKPNLIVQQSLAADQRQTRLPLPAAFRSANVMIEARGGGLRRRQTHFANSIRVQMIENSGQLKVTQAASDKPASKVYVKVFSDTGGTTKFHKDGYTDLRGRFDYAAVSGVSLDGVDRFAILVLDEELGAIIREVKPPAQ